MAAAFRFCSIAAIEIAEPGDGTVQATTQKEAVPIGIIEYTPYSYTSARPVDRIYKLVCSHLSVHFVSVLYSCAVEQVIIIIK